MSTGTAGRGRNGDHDRCHGMWLKVQGIDDALIQPYSGLSLSEAQSVYKQMMKQFV